MTVYGYARVSTEGQTLDAQIAQLRAARCTKIFREKISGARADRAQLAQLVSTLDKDDVVIVTRLDRLARSTRAGEGRERAKARGVRLGRKAKLNPHQRREALARRALGEPLTEIARTYAVSHSTISRLR